MRKLILKMSMSVDGFVGGPKGELDWIFQNRDDEGKAWTVETLWNAGLHLMGNRTLRDMAAYWPSSIDVFAAPMNQIPKVAFSRGGTVDHAATTRALEDARARALPTTKPDADVLESWRSARILTGDLVEEVTRLKQEPGKDLLAHGGAEFAQNLARRGLVDEYRLLVHPVALGRGLPLFSQLPAPATLERIELKAFKNGTVAHVYRTAKRPT